MNEERIDRTSRETLLALVLAAITFLLYLYANPLSGSFYDYTFRIGLALLEGRLGLSEEPPAWLNEMIPLDGRYYSAFPLGSVLSMTPLVILKKLQLIDSFPGVKIAALIAALNAVLFFKLSAKRHDRYPRRLVLTLFPVLGTWMWSNLAFGGAWQIALGVAVAGQLAALYFTLIAPRPWLAGLFFAMAFGNRTEIILLTPIFLYLSYRQSDEQLVRWKAMARFMAVPTALSLATIIYNYARFSSIFDFGYAHIPGVLDEPWYQHGIFSVHAIPGNAQAMLFETWRRIDHSPYLVPTGFGGSIFLSSPFLIYLFRWGARDPVLKRLAWCAIGILTLVLWLHGNPGGWQVSYRYAIELLPWMFLILLENSPKRVTIPEIALLAISIAINAYAAYLFLNTGYMNP
ncbi:MAG TPA: hypothetical protein VJ302_04305 [Blastocatellia bacterium]|nr:hypothetical protein [Blastocatellia bacterium]